MSKQSQVNSGLSSVSGRIWATVMVECDFQALAVSHGSRTSSAVAKLRSGSENQIVNKKSAVNNRENSSPALNNTASADSTAPAPFHSGAIVLATLRDPREKIWGALLALDPAGLSVQGLELSSFEDATTAVISGEPLNSAILFFPMHRIERIALDLPEGNLPSLSQRFQSRTGLEPGEALAGAIAAERSAGA